MGSGRGTRGEERDGEVDLLAKEPTVNCSRN